ncbi:MAG: hypothetical protein PHT32_04920, partial [Candidatus Omnitrophica bacterium]|nr:hypothetical protein [Candidatus Omnitrophota bacterium]
MITKRLFLFLRSFRVKIALAMIILMLLSGMVGNFLVYQYAMRAKLDEAREELMMVAQAMALDVDADTILKIPLSEEGMETPQYRSVADKLSRI